MLTTLLASAVTGVAAWVLTHFIARPILDIRQVRLKAISVGEMYANIPPPASRQDEEDIKAAKRAVFETIVGLRTHLRGQSWVVRMFCRALRYDLEGAITALGDLETVVGSRYGYTTRKNLLNLLYLSLNAHTHMTNEQVVELRQWIAKLKAEHAAAS
jgi:hypothetical protein